MSIRSSDGKNFRRITRTSGDRVPAVGIRRPRAFYTATGGETSLDLNSLSPQISYQPGQAQIEVKSSAGPMLSGVDFYETSGSTLTFPSPGLAAGEILEITQTFQYSGNLVAQVRPDEYSVVGAAGQTVIDADFSWPLNQNPSKRHGAIQVFVNGILQQRGASQDYVETQIGSSSNTNRITLNSALIGGENVSILRNYEAIDETAAATQFNNTRLTELQEYFKTGFQAYVDEETYRIPVPFTQIVKRASIPDLTQDLKVRVGVERIAVQQIYQLQDEFGPNGEPVWGAVNDDRGLIRFVGGGWTNSIDGNSQRPAIGGGSTSTAEYVEVTFYGTGLNLLAIVYSSANDLRVSIDGGAEGSNILGGAAYSSVIISRNYASNNIVNVASNLSLGIHTVKIRKGAGGASTDFNLFGFEVLNTSTSNLVVNPGTAFSNGRKLSLLAQSTSLLNKPATVTGGRGGRVVTYLDTDGAVKQAVTLTNAAQANLTSADHTNEEVARTYYFREFGAGRTDDFSSLVGSGSNRAFTLEDGTTTLVCQSHLVVNTNGQESLRANAVNDFLTLTFIGTGLDIFNVRSDSTFQYTVFIDGVSVGTGRVFSGGANKIASGLPYGTHTAKILLTTGGVAADISKFIVYVPKKPSLPSGAVELADYNVMADYVNDTTVSGANATEGTMSTGVLMKSPARELTYVGSWSIGGTGVNISALSGIELTTATNTNYFEYSFYGTGIEMMTWYANAVSFNQTFTIDNLALNAGSNIGSVCSVHGPSLGTIAITSAGVLSGTSAAGSNGYNSKVRISNLPLGIHKLRVTKTGGTGNLWLYGLRYITPIHAPVSSLPAGFQNTLPVGSCSISDSRLLSPVRSESPKKAWARAVGVSASPTTTSSAWVPIPDMSTTITLKKPAKIAINFCGRVQNPTATVYFNVSVNGTLLIPAADGEHSAMAAVQGVAAVTDIVYLPAGTHKIDIYWTVNGGTATAQAKSRIMTVMELD